MKAFLWDLWANEQVRLAVHTLGRLLLAAVLGGIIGFEREHSHRPAGLRTHILVAVGSALVMCTSTFIFQYYAEMFEGKSVPDPARLGAQVISGIGFLGAGTILREGFSVKGLTTAASLWAVSCVGLAAGIGFWHGALLATAVIYFTLNALKKVSFSKPNNRTLFVGVSDADAAAEKLVATLRNCGVKLQSLEMLFPDEGMIGRISQRTTTVLKATVFIHSPQAMELVRESVLNLAEVNDFYSE